MKNIYLLSNSSYEGVNSLPMIDINYLDFKVDFSSYDSLIFTSKNAVIAIQNEPLWKELDSYAISEQTASLLENKDAKLVYTGKSRDGSEFAKEIAPILKGKKVLYLRAKEVVSNLVNILIDKGIDLEEKVVYETVCKKYENKHFEKDSIFIFTSPSTVECFFKSFTWKNSFKAVSIGTTTALALPKEVKCHIAKEKSIKSCVELAKGL